MGFLLHLGVGIDGVWEDSACEFSVVKLSASIRIVLVVKGPHLLVWVVHAKLLHCLLKLPEVNVTITSHVEELEHFHETSFF